MNLALQFVVAFCGLAATLCAWRGQRSWAMVCGVAVALLSLWIVVRLAAYGIDA